ncbi:MAG: hypothetical protein M3348_06815 [Acidobacteriota bacterium]|nr:hypothetical protein [Acidobacteriota bacterium]
MRNLLPGLRTPAALLWLYFAATQFVTGLYLARRAALPPAFTLLYPLGLLWAVGWWLRDDSRRRGVAWVFDMGLFLYIAWPLFMPYYLLKTRGAKGLLLMLAFAVVYGGALAAGVALYALLTLDQTT